MARSPSALHLPLHADLGILGERRRGFFAKLTTRRLKRGVFHSIVFLQEAINRYVAQANDDPRPFYWSKDPDKVIAAVRRGHQLLDSLH